ncbi:sigma factor G inhibitor Gin [Clostridiaceae bacterium M8S5]|nr:sigma factor G inhibitor Gin [Clostridiaceae bacterium M8S5]
MVIHKCSICGRKHVNCIKILQSYICVNCEKEICKVVTEKDANYINYITGIKHIWARFV